MMIEKGNKMKGSIRMVIGFLLVFGAVGGMDVGPAEDFYYQLAGAVIGLGLMFSGVNAMNRSEFK
jgi:hypothetical protein